MGCKKLSYFYATFLAMIWHLLKYWIAFILPSFYKRIQGKNLKNLQVKGPVIIAMNHPNAFTDPIILSYLSYPLRLKYVARGDAFKPGVISWLLGQIGIVPVFRLQDGGIEGLKKNDASYRLVNSLLKRNFKIIVFAEGICVQERRLRPLKKGLARMVFGAFEALNNDELVVIPVGINYNNANKFRSHVFCNVGDPIAVKDFITQYHQNPAKANHALLQTLQPKMKELITHIDDKNYDEVVYRVEELCKKDLIREQHLNAKNLEHDFIVLKQLTERVNEAVKNNIAVVDEFKISSDTYFSDLNKYKVRDWLVNRLQNKNLTFLNVAIRVFLLLISFPIYAIGMTGNYLPYRLTEKVTRKIVKNVEFYSSFAIGLSMVFLLLNYVMWFILFKIITPNILCTLSLCSLLALCGWFCLFYHPFFCKTLGMIRLLKNKKIALDLMEKRKNLISLINKF